MPTESDTEDSTRGALIRAATHLFGVNGYDGTSIRAIAARAGTNVASIAYHFGGKEALRMACGTAMASSVVSAIQPPPHLAATTPEEAEQALEQILRHFVRFVTLDPASADGVRFLLREISEHGPVVEAVFDRFVGPLHEEFCNIWSAATGMPASSEETRLAVFSMIGQALYFRLGQFVVCRRMGWETYDEANVDRITGVLLDNLHATLAAKREAQNG